jgi:hypothetical protein
VEVPAEIIPLGRGKYEVSFIPREAVLHLIHVSFNDTQIEGLSMGVYVLVSGLWLYMDLKLLEQGVRKSFLILWCTPPIDLRVLVILFCLHAAFLFVYLLSIRSLNFVACRWFCLQYQWNSKQKLWFDRSSFPMWGVWR